MKKLVAIALAGFLISFSHGAPLAADQSASAQAAVSPSPTPAAKKVTRVRRKAEPTPSPSPTPEKKRSWLYRLFHRPPKAAPAASPEPSSSPKPGKMRITAKPTPTPAGEVSPTPKPARIKKKVPANPEPNAEEEETPAPKRRTTTKATPEPQEGMNEPAPFIPTPTPAPRTESRQIGGEQELAHFRDIRAKALGDEHVKELQEKADNAPEGDAQKKATQEYYKALFGKMRKLDPTLKDRIDRAESATTRAVQKVE